MSLNIAVPLESADGERRVALDPSAVARLRKRHKVKVAIETGCGAGAGFYDDSYEGTTVYPSFATLVSDAAVVLKVNPPSMEEAKQLPLCSVLISQISSYLNSDVVEVLRERHITTFAMDHMPRITRAQSMDVLSSQATVAGYKAALLAAELSPRLFPMLTTAAGTIRPSRVIVIGAGVAGLQAIATARRLGAQVEAYDIRRAAREQIESLGARMIDTGVEAEGPNGMARGLNKEEKQKQHDVLADHMAQAHAIICAAAIPGRRAPRIITKDMVERMMPDTVIVDMAAETGGNCELTRVGESYMHGDTQIVGPLNLPSSGAVHATEMYARNLLNMLKLMLNDKGELQLDWQDEVLSGCLLTHKGQVFHAATAALMNLECAPPIGQVRERSKEEPDQAAGWIAEEDDELPLTTKVESEAVEEAQGKTSSALPNSSGDKKVQPSIPVNNKQPVAAEQINSLTGSSSTATPSSPVTENSTNAEVVPADSSNEQTEQESISEEAPVYDNLMVIDGIGPALQNRLYAFGFTYYTDLAILDEAGIATLLEQLDGNDDLNIASWVSQAAELQEQS